jgi:uncharacterized protein (TIGR03085 family)
MTTTATAERRELCDLLDALGPDAPTLCEGWNTVDLAAHLLIRERRPDGAAGILFKPLAGYAKRVHDDVAARPWPELVERVRGGPPVLAPTRLAAVDRLVNTIEFYVHHEDVRRAQPSWTARQLDRQLTDDLYAGLKRTARLLARKAPGGLVLQPSDDHPPIVAKRGTPSVTVRGPVGELVLFAYGRQDHALVELDGPTDLVDAMRTASFGI